MTTTPQTVADFIGLAREAILAKDFDAAETYKKQAEALKSVDDLGRKPPVDTSQRLPFPVGGTSPAVDGSAMDIAVKSAYVTKYGEIDGATSQVLKELYGTDNYPALRAAKYADMSNYCKYGVADPRLSRMVLLPADMVIQAIMEGVGVGGIDGFKATMVEAQQTLLGYMVPEEINQEIVTRLPGMTVVRGLARKFTTGGDQLSFLVRTGGTKRYIGNMRSKQTAESPVANTYNTNATFGKLNIPVHVNLSKVPVSKAGLEDSKLDVMREVLMPEFQTEAAITEDAQFLTGTGAGEPQGILNGTSANGAPFNADVATRNSGQASVITFDGVVKAPWDVAGQYRARKNPSTAYAFTSATGLALSVLQDNEGRYLWTEMAGNNAQGNPDTLRGWQYKESEALPEIAANTYPVIFGDFSGYRIVDRVGMSIQRYDDSATADTDSVVFFCRRRYGGQVAEGYKFVVIKIST